MAAVQRIVNNREFSLVGLGESKPFVTGIGISFLRDTYLVKPLDSSTALTEGLPDIVQKTNFRHHIGLYDKTNHSASDARFSKPFWYKNDNTNEERNEYGLNPRAVSFLAFVSELDKGATPRSASSFLISRIELYFSQRNIQAVNDLLVAFDPSAHSHWPSTAIVRSTFRARHLLPAWRNAFDKTKAALVQKDLPWRTLLAGLIDDARA